MAAIGYLYFTLKFKKEETKTVEKDLRNQINKLGNENNNYPSNICEKCLII